MGLISSRHSKRDRWLSLYGYLTVSGCKGSKKLKKSKKKLWCIYDVLTIQLLCYKSAKDSLERTPFETINLKDAVFYFGNSEEHEFTISVKGKEFSFKADSHQLMMMWLNGLQEKIMSNDDSLRRSNTVPSKIQRSKSLDLERVLEEEQEINQNNQPSVSMSVQNVAYSSPSPEHVARRTTSKESRLQKAFSMPLDYLEDGASFNEPRSQSLKNRPYQSENHLADIDEVDFSVPGNLSRKKLCKHCAVLQDKNAFLNAEVQTLSNKLYEEMEKTNSIDRQIEELQLENFKLKRQLLTYIHDELIKEEEDAKLQDFENNKSYMKLLEMLNEARTVDRTLPTVNRSSTSSYTDKHGFLHGVRESPSQVSLHLCHELRGHYSERIYMLNFVKERWEEYLRINKDQDCFHKDDILSPLIIAGIPNVHRGEVWKKLIAHQVKHIKEEKGSNYYRVLQNTIPPVDPETEDDSSVEKQIRVDLLRTLPTNSRFKDLESEGVQKLHRVLRAYLFHNKDVGYCQGMNFMVALFLLFLDEEDAFWGLMAITEVYFSPTHYNQYLSGSQADQNVLDALMKQKLPQQAEFLNEKACELSPVTFNWFMTIFIDSVPTEVVFRIWDIFLLEGHQVLYRFAIALLTMKQKTIFKLKDSLAIMKYLKKIGKEIHDVDEFIKMTFEGIEPFPTDKTLLKMYQDHFAIMEEKHKEREKEDKEYEQQVRKLKFQPKPLTVQMEKDFRDLPEDMIIECAEPEENANLIWLCCSSHNSTQVFIFDIMRRRIDPAKKEIASRSLCMARAPATNTMIVGTANATLHGFDIESREEVWTLQVGDSVSSIACDVSGNIIATLADGAVAVTEQKAGSKEPGQAIYKHIGRAPVVSGCIDGDYMWCGCGNVIVIVDMNTLDEVESIQVCPNFRHTVSKLVMADYGIWCTVRGSSVLHLYDRKTFDLILTADVVEECGLASEKVSHLSGTRITALLPRGRELWAGLGNGRFVIFDLKNGPKVYKNGEAPKMRTPVDGCIHDAVSTAEFEGEQAPHVMDAWDEKVGFVFISKENNKKSFDDDDDGIKYHLDLKQLQRISEEPVRCLLVVRSDKRLILSCVGSLCDDWSIIVWSVERREGREMWYANAVSYS